MSEMCACGKPLHYTQPEMQAIVEKMIAKLGEFVEVTCEGKIYKVSRNFIALHGIKASELPQLAAELGFEVQQL